MGVCKQLREQKSYLVYTAVGILGISAIKDLVKEVTVTINYHIKFLISLSSVLIGMSLYLLCDP